MICAGALASAGCGKREVAPAKQAEPTVAKPAPTGGETAEPLADTTASADEKNGPAVASPPAQGQMAGQLGGGGRANGSIGYDHAFAAGPMRKAPPPRGDEGDNEPNTEAYDHHDVNKLTLSKDDHLSTFAIDVDTASYSIVRKKILAGQAVPPDAVRVEEFLNYFHYSYEGPGDDRPFAVHMEAAPSPYAPARHLLRVAVQGKQVAKRDRKPAHLVFLVDVSGSMMEPDKLPLAQRSLRILVDNLGEKDTVAIVTYAGATRVVLRPTTMDKKAEIYSAIDELTAGGSTDMGSGIELAYQLASKQVGPASETRVIVLSDGDANVGNTTHESILKTIKGYVKEGVTLSTVGFGMGNYKDNLMEQLADKGNGNAYYIDGLSEAKKVFQEQLGGTLEVIAQDVKIQVDFNPKSVTAYRLVGYENRDIADHDFRNDKVDAGEIGAGHAVTAVYEVELARDAEPTLATVRIRAKKPRGTEAAEYAYPFETKALEPTFADASPDFRWAAAVMGFAEILRKSPYADGWKLDTVLTIAQGAAGAGNAERQEFLSLVGKARSAS
jgi:Ca-activated chloride channel family protein